MVDAGGAIFVRASDLFGPGRLTTLLRTLDADALERVWMEPPREVSDDHGSSLEMRFLFERSLALKMAGLESVALVVGGSGENTVVNARVTSEPTFGLAMLDLPITLRVDSGLLHPARRVPSDDGSGERIEIIADAEGLDIVLASVTFSVDIEGHVSIDAEAGADLPLCLIGDTGVAMEAHGVRFLGGRETPPAGKPEGWRGLYVASAEIYLPHGLGAEAPDRIELSGASIGTGGLSGKAETVWTPPLGSTLSGFPCTLSAASVTFTENCLSAFSLNGILDLPFFDQPIGVDIGLTTSGDVTASLSAIQPPSVARRDDGLIEFEKPGLLRMRIDSVGFAGHDSDFTVRLSGAVKLLYGAIDWPEVEVRELSIDRDGHVRIQGGWLDLPRSASLDFNGFAMELHRIGFGKSGGRNWIGFSGGIRLVEQLSFGASVDGLKVLWDSEGHVDVQMSSIAVELTVPDVLAFTGRVDYVDEPGVKSFRGDVELTLDALETTFGASLMVGRHTDAPVFNFGYVYVDVQLPAGIPLAQTNLAIYGFAGLLGINVAPNKPDAMEWFQWYSGAPVGVTATSKWQHEFGSQALGAGLTLGTAADNGYAFSAKALLVVMFPGPLLLIDGKANLLEDRSKLDGTAQGQHRALAVIDRRAGTFLVNLQPTFKYDPLNGAVIQVTGPAEAFFDYTRPDAWHLYLGEDQPIEKRIRARILKGLLNADAYLMLDRQGMRLGAGAGLDREYEFGRLSVALAARISGQADISWRPTQMDGVLTYEAVAELRAFGLSASVSVDTELEVLSPDPYYIYGRFRVRLRTPWPLPDPSARITLEWGNPDGETPLDPTVGRMAAEHLKVMDTWDLRLGSDLVEAAVPTIPLDARILVSFNRPIADEALVGCNAAPPPAAERIGSVEVMYELRSIVLERKTGEWDQVETRADGEGTLFGMWLPSSDRASAAAQLQLWSTSPFTSTRNSGRAYVDRFLEDNPGYPCAPSEPAETVCVDFRGVPTRLLPPIFVVGDVIFEFAFTDKAMQPRLVLQSGVPVLSLTFRADPVRLHMTPSEPAAMVQVKIAGAAPGVSLTAYGVEGLLDSQHSTAPDEVILTVNGKAIEHVVLDVDRPTAQRQILVLEVCFVPQADKDRAHAVERARQHLRSQMTDAAPPWCGKGHLLAPDSLYKLSVTTVVRRWREGAEASPLGPRTDVTYFRTAGPPGDFRTAGPLRDLSSYVDDNASSPANDAPDWYGAYDLRIAFNENYVERLYDGNGRPLSVVLLDRNGSMARDTSGAAVESAPGWETDRRMQASAADGRWLWSLHKAAEAGCGPMTTGDCVARRDTLVVQLGGRPLAPRQLVEVSLSAGGASTPLHRRRFTSSRFATFAHHIQSFDDAAWDQPLAAPVAATRLGEIVRAKRDEHPGFDAPWEATAFDDLSRTVFTLGTRTLPERLEVTVLRDAERSYALLVESPEPIDWRRTAIVIRNAPATEARGTRATGALKIVGAAVASGEESDFNREWIEVMALADTDVSGVGIRYDASAETAPHDYAFENQPRIAAGTIIRIHAGAPPAGTVPVSERLLRYATAPGGQPIWHVSPAGGLVSLVNPEGAQMHRAVVRPAADFQAPSHVLIRSADQTRSFIFFISSSDLMVTDVPPGLLRIDWTFLRAAGPSVPLLTRGGSSDPEQATIEIVI